MARQSIDCRQLLQLHSQLITTGLHHHRRSTLLSLLQLYLSNPSTFPHATTISHQIQEPKNYSLKWNHMIRPTSNTNPLKALSLFQEMLFTRAKNSNEKSHLQFHNDPFIYASLIKACNNAQAFVEAWLPSYSATNRGCRAARQPTTPVAELLGNQLWLPSCSAAAQPFSVAYGTQTSSHIKGQESLTGNLIVQFGDIFSYDHQQPNNTGINTSTLYSSDTTFSTCTSLINSTCSSLMSDYYAINGVSADHYFQGTNNILGELDEVLFNGNINPQQLHRTMDMISSNSTSQESCSWGDISSLVYSSSISSYEVCQQKNCSFDDQSRRIGLQ
ncbi:Uncharacterized protein Fot_48334 [Forsythia ovata]|uniref:Uncharacterized protein n=1 Tax=Forsythia ovata TaxID=205694 RepID=A0ABD1QAG7_9LAMI